MIWMWKITPFVRGRSIGASMLCHAVTTCCASILPSLVGSSNLTEPHCTMAAEREKHEAWAPAPVEDDAAGGKATALNSTVAADQQLSAITPGISNPPVELHRNAHLAGTFCTAEARCLEVIAKSSSTGNDKLIAVSQLCASLVSFESLADAQAAADVLCTEKLLNSLKQLVVEGDSMVVLVIQLLHCLCLNPKNAEKLASCGIFPVLTAALRAEDELLRAQGLAFLAVLAEQEGMELVLANAGICSLLASLSSSSSSDIWYWIVVIVLALLPRTAQLRPPHRKQLLRTLRAAAERLADGSLRLQQSECRLLKRALGEMHVYTRMLKSAPIRPVAVRAV
eukprot:6206789-Pleurochrysis_carterae.AAC.4